MGAFLSFLSLGVQAAGHVFNWMANNDSNDISQSQLDLRQKSYNENLRSNYYSYMQQLESMRNEYAQDSVAINQERENIASNQSYLDRWASEYDQSMQTAIDESYNQYQALASNYASGLVSNGETGRRGGSVARLASDSGTTLASYNGGSTNGLNLTGGRLGSYLQSTSMDMLADKQTALSAVGTSYKAINSYQTALENLSGSIGSLKATTDEMKTTLDGKGLKV